MEITILGIDLSKSVFQFHGANARGKAVLRQKLKREEVLSFTAQLPKCRIVMEACGSSHYWARKFNEQGHQAQLIAAQFVKPFKKGKQKNDRNDAEAIVEAASRPNMRYVNVKTLWQQDLQSLHRVRQQLLGTKTMIVNQCRGLLAEYGVTIDEGIIKFKNQLPGILETADNGLTDTIREIAHDLYRRYLEVQNNQNSIEDKIKAYAKRHGDIERLMQVPGVGLLGASMFLSSVGTGCAFSNGRHVAAWVGLVPRQHSSAGLERSYGITKAGDHHLRSMLIHGARALILSVIKKQGKDPLSQWILRLYKQKGWNVTAVAVANRNTRVMFHLLKHQEDYKAAV